MGRRGPKPIFTAEERREHRRAHMEAKRRAAGILPRSKQSAEYRKSVLERAFRIRIDRNKAFVFAFKAEHPCVDCGFSDPRALTFDHRDRARKNFTVSEWVLAGRSLETIKAEIAKCDVRCANCHMIRTTEHEDWRQLEDWEIAAAQPARGD